MDGDRDRPRPGRSVHGRRPPHRRGLGVRGDREEAAASAGWGGLLVGVVRVGVVVRGGVVVVVGVVGEEPAGRHGRCCLKLFLAVGVVLLARLRIRVVLRWERRIPWRGIYWGRGEGSRRSAVSSEGSGAADCFGNGVGERGSGTFWKKGGDWGRRQGSAMDDAWAQVRSGRHAGRGGGVSHDVDSEARSAGAERSGASD